MKLRETLMDEQVLATIPIILATEKLRMRLSPTPNSAMTAIGAVVLRVSSQSWSALTSLAPCRAVPVGSSMDR